MDDRDEIDDNNYADTELRRNLRIGSPDRDFFEDQSLSFTSRVWLRFCIIAVLILVPYVIGILIYLSGRYIGPLVDKYILQHIM